MICYMPLTVLDEQNLEMLTNTFGPLTVYSPSGAIVPPHMRTFEQQGKLEILHPQGVNQDQLLSAIDNYKSWADLHQGNIEDMAGFFKTQQGQIPMMDETSPTRIGHQIRHYGESPQQASVDPLFKAALFLSMAQEYDLHQHGMLRDMKAVNAMEQQMLHQLSGDSQEAQMAFPSDAAQISSSVHSTIDDTYMTTQRIREWSRLALSDAQSPDFYLTSSKAVIEHLQDFFPDMMETACLDLSSPHILQTLQKLSLASDEDSHDAAMDVDSASGGDDNRLTLYRLAGIAPLEFLTRLADPDRVADAAEPIGGPPKSTYIGWVVN